MAAVAVGAGLYVKRNSLAAAPAAGASPAVSTLAPGSAGSTASKSGVQVLPSLAPPTGSRRMAAVPTTATTAPTVSNLHVVSYSGGIAVLAWTGTMQATYKGGDNTGYNLYQKTASGWKIVQVEVDPPLRVQAPAGTVFGIAPTYLTPGGQEIAGGIVSVTV